MSQNALRIFRIVRFVAALTVSASIVIVGITVAIAGEHDTAEVLSFTALRIETTLWPTFSRLIAFVGVTSSRAERDVWTALVELESAGPNGRRIPTAIDPHASWPSYERESPDEVNARVVAGWAPGNSGTPDAAAAVAQFVVQNRKTAAVNCHQLPANCICVPRAAFDRHLKESDGWSAFSHENQNVRQYITLSRVGFNARHTVAVVYSSTACGALCGGGGYFVFSRSSGQWKLIAYNEKWVS
jgi:hypothetical protein